MRFKFITHAAGLLLALWASPMLAQSNYQQVVESTESGSKVFLEINLMHLQQSMDSIFLQLTESSTTNWGDVLINGSNPGMDIDFSSYDIMGLGGLTSTGTLTADSLFLNKDADLTGKLSVTDVVSFGDSLTVSGYVQFSDSLNVVKAVSIGETLYVTGVTALGDSLHVVGNVDLDALFNVDGAATFGSTLAVTGKTTLSDSLLVNSGARISGTLYADSAVVEDVINGQVSSLANHTTSGLAEGTNLYFTNERAIEALSDTLAYLLGLIAQLQEGGSGGGSDAFTCGTSTVTFDGHDYSTVVIGGQCWFAENLRTTQYADGSAIPEVTGDAEWGSTTDGARAAYDNDADNVSTYGYLYNWYAVDSAAGLCPTGWHVPTDAEWTTLTDSLGGAFVAGGAMKSSASDTPAWDGTNSSGFSALPGGTRFGSGSFFDVGDYGFWWSASPSNSTYAWYRSLNSGYDNVNRPTNVQWVGLSVRCVGDAAVVSSASAPTVSSAAASDLAETTATLNGTVDADGGDAVTATGFVWGTDSLLSGASDAGGSATSGSFTASLTGLTGGTTYYFSAYATNGEGTAYGDTLSFATTPAAAGFTCGTSTVTFDGHDYSTVVIGDQCWFAENLRSTQYADGSSIPEVTDASAWAATSDGARAANGNDATNLSTYGYLYNWHAVNNAAGLCPTDWHVPTDAEWTTLTDGLGGVSVAGEAMKSSASDTPAWNGTNTSGFSAIPGGNRDKDGQFFLDVADAYSVWWSKSLENAYWAWFRNLRTTLNSGTVNRYSARFNSGFSVRCVGDAAVVSSASAPTVSSGAASDLAETTATLNGTVDADGGDAVTATGFVWGTDATLSGASNASGSATSGSFTASLTGLTGGTTYYFSAYATNGEGTAYGDTLSFATTPAAAAFTCGTSAVTFDGHAYSTVVIGDQCWFAENLRTTKYADGSAIPDVTDASAWATTTEGARGAYNDDAGNLATYGYLYNWYAVDSAAGLCPTGWHVPTDAEWTTLTDGLGGVQVAGAAIKSSASDTPAWNGTNTSGFSALPGGIRFSANNFFVYVGSNGYWWSASPEGTDAWYRRIEGGYDKVFLEKINWRTGFSVRCVGDAAVVSSASAPTVSSGAASDLAETTATLNGTVDADGGDAVTATGFVWGTDATLSGASNASGSATSGSFTASLTGLTGGTTYYFSAYATNGEGTDYGDTMSFTTTSAVSAFTCGTSAVTFDGHAYSTVVIGDQCWFAENLRSTQYADGSAIPEVTDPTTWSSSTDGARVAYDNDASNLATYGYLYNWYAVDSAAGLCPTGWHVPTDAEWTTLTDGLGGVSVAGEAMKSSASDTPAWNGTNTSGFSALPGGYRLNDGDFYDVGDYGYWWSASPNGDNAWNRYLDSDFDGVGRYDYYRRGGFSVRCVRD